MRTARGLFLAMAAMMSVAGAQPAETPVRPAFCLALDRIIAASAERPPFASLRRNLASDPNRVEAELPGLEWCHIGRSRDVGGRTTLWCTRSLAPVELTSERLAADTARCLGAEPVRGEDRGYRLDHKGVVMLIEESCTDACHVGRRVSYGVVARAP